MIKSAIKMMVTSSNDRKTLRWTSDQLTRLVNAVDAKVRVIDSAAYSYPNIKSFDGVRNFAPCVRQSTTPWSAMKLPECKTPGMLSEEESRYLLYVGQFYSGAGEVVELGPWLGKSTFHIIEGLRDNPNFTGRKLHVFDDFVWRPDWMDHKVAESQRLPRHADFQFMFENYNKAIADRILPLKRMITPYDGNEALERVSWDGRPVEMMIVDCGRTIEANEAWWRIFVHSFIPHKTILVLQDWETHRQVPVKFYNQLKFWIDSKGEQLRLVHELTHGAIGTFVYCGPPSE